MKRDEKTLRPLSLYPHLRHHESLRWYAILFHDVCDVLFHDTLRTLPFCLGSTHTPSAAAPRRLQRLAIHPAAAAEEAATSLADMLLLIPVRSANGCAWASGITRCRARALADDDSKTKAKGIEWETVTLALSFAQSHPFPVDCTQHAADPAASLPRRSSALCRHPRLDA